VFGAMMVREGLVDGQVHGIGESYPRAIRPALQVIPKRKGVSKISGLYLMVSKDRTLLFADTTVNIQPSAEDLAETALLAAEKASFFGLEPRVAMLSFSNFGSVRHPEAGRVTRALQLVRERKPDLIIDGEMQADTAVVPEILREGFPFNRLEGKAANVLIFPDLTSGNVAYKLLDRLGGAKAVGPLLMGLKHPFNVLQRNTDMENVVNVIAITVAQAQNRKQGAPS
jgi:malate dehydrogenase (oxaloacetate-decarboxylating)(NADP+)